MTKNPLRVRIVHDSSAEDPREWDDMCRIGPTHVWRNPIEKQIADLIIRTNGWRAMEEMASVAGHGTLNRILDNEDRLHDDETFRNTWLEAVKGELIVDTFSIQHETYIAYSTPEMCRYVGTPWDEAARVMAGSVETFKQWVEGDVYGYIIEECIDVDDGDWIEVDACWGFYGSDPFENGISDSVPEELHEQLRHVEIEYNY